MDMMVMDMMVLMGYYKVTNYYASQSIKHILDDESLSRTYE